MKSSITIALPEDLRKEIDRVSEVEGISRSDLIRQSVRDYLFVREFRSLRTELSGRSPQGKRLSDEDVFEQVS
jgi:metal-responsive CopG/Arc/MetJ family transcriptional regulator